MAARDDMSIPSTSNPFNPFRASITRSDPEPSARPKQGLSTNLTKKPESRSADEAEFMSYIGTFGSPVSCHAIRIEPGQELRKSLLGFVSEKKLKAPFIMTCVGSAKNAKLRMATNLAAEDEHYLLDLQGPLEIICLSGTFSANGQCHLHVSLSNETGKVLGGHLIELTVHTTAEVIIGECSAMVFERELDPRTTYPELLVKER